MREYKTKVCRWCGQEYAPEVHRQYYCSLQCKLEDNTVPCPSGCLMWAGSCTADGYGNLRWLGDVVRAHRAAYEAFVGEVPEGMQVLHKCDVRGCCRPEHLFLGTNADNVADKVAKGRQAKGETHARQCGEEHSQAKLTEDDVRAIRQDPRVQREIAADYGINRSLVSVIKSRKIWSHVK